LAWVLSKAYGYAKPQIAEVIQQILITKEFFIEDAENAFKALQLYQKKPAGFADCFLAQTHQSMGAEYTVSFDKKALKSHLFHSLSTVLNGVSRCSAICFALSFGVLNDFINRIYSAICTARFLLLISMTLKPC